MTFRFFKNLKFLLSFIFYSRLISNFLKKWDSYITGLVLFLYFVLYCNSRTLIIPWFFWSFQCNSMYLCIYIFINLLLWIYYKLCIYVFRLLINSGIFWIMVSINIVPCLFCLFPSPEDSIRSILSLFIPYCISFIFFKIKLWKYNNTFTRGLENIEWGYMYFSTIYCKYF